MAAPTLPSFQLLAGFGSLPGAPFTFTDISPYLRSFQVQRTSTRNAGPLYAYQPGTVLAVLKNGDGRFDPDNLNGPYVSTTGIMSQTFTVSVAGAGSWNAPANLVGTATVQCWGGGGGGGGASSASYVYNGGGGGGGEYAEELALAVTAGSAYSYTVGSPGSAGTAGNGGSAGGNTTFTGDAVTVTAHGGTGGNHGTTASGGSQGAGGAGGTGSSNTIVFAGGTGGTGAGGTGTGGGGGGGGGSGGEQATGNNGGTATTSKNGSNQANGAAAVPGGGPGGTSAASPTTGPGGGGGGGYNENPGAKGYRGQLIITYTVTVPSVATTEVTGMVPVQLSAMWQGMTFPQFTGYADGWQDGGLNLPSYAEVTLTATDAMKALGRANLPATGPAGAGEDTGARFNRILDNVGWPAALRNITPGDTVQQAYTGGDYAVNLLQVAADTEAGEFYVDPSGNITFRHRDGILQDWRSAVPQAIFGDNPGPGLSGSAQSWDFEDGTAQGWAAAAFSGTVTAANSTAWSYNGTHSLLFSVTSGPANLPSFGAPALTVTPGEMHGMSAILHVPATSPAIGNILVGINWLASGVFLSGSQTAPAFTMNPGDTLAVSCLGQRVPAGANQAQPVIVIDAPAAAGTKMHADYVLWDPVLAYTQPGRADDMTTLVNDVQFTRVGSVNLQEATSRASIVQTIYQITYSRTDLMFASDADTLAAAQWVLQIGVPTEDRLDTLTIMPQRDPYGIYPQVFGRQIGDLIRYVQNPPGMVAPVIRDLYIRGITASFDASTSTVTVQWQTQDGNKYGSFLTLDDPVYGRVDLNGLAY